MSAEPLDDLYTWTECTPLGVVHEDAARRTRLMDEVREAMEREATPAGTPVCAWCDRPFAAAGARIGIRSRFGSLLARLRT